MNNPKLRFRDDSGSRFVDWQKVSFGKTFSFLKSSAFSRAQLNYRGGQIKNVHYGDILVKFPTILNSCCNDVPYINPAEKTEKYDLLQVGDIVIADTAEDLTVGKAIEISDVSNNIIAGLHTIACRPQRKFANRFLGYYLNSKAFHNQLVPLATGIKVYSIIKSEIVKTRINVPCLEEQQKIANFFSTFDEKIELSERKLEALEQLKKGLMQKIFNQEIRFKRSDGSMYKNWERTRISRLFNFIRNGFVGTIAPHYTDKNNGIRYLQGTNIHNGRISDNIEQYVTKEFNQAHSKNILKHDDILMVQSGHVGECAVVGNYAGSNCHALIIMSNAGMCSSDYIRFYFESSIGKRQLALISVGNTVKHILASDVSKLSVLIPEIEEQEKIANLFLSIEKRIDIVEKQLESLKQLKKGFMQQMFV